jgi:hypothetical protein
MYQDPRQPGDTDEPTTEEALPGVELGSDEETEREGRETMGPDAVEDDDQKS